MFHHDNIVSIICDGDLRYHLRLNITVGEAQQFREILDDLNGVD